MEKSNRATPHPALVWVNPDHLLTAALKYLKAPGMPTSKAQTSSTFLHHKNTRTIANNTHQLETSSTHPTYPYQVSYNHHLSSSKPILHPIWLCDGGCRYLQLLFVQKMLTAEVPLQKASKDQRQPLKAVLTLISRQTTYVRCSFPSLRLASCTCLLKALISH